MDLICQKVFKSYYKIKVALKSMLDLKSRLLRSFKYVSISIVTAHAQGLVTGNSLFNLRLKHVIKKEKVIIDMVKLRCQWFVTIS